MHFASLTEIFCDHRTMKGHHVTGIAEKRQEGRDVAVAYKKLGMQLDLFQVQPRQQVVATVSAARANDGAHLVALKHLFQLAGTALDGAGKVQVLVKNRSEIERLISQFCQSSAAGFEQLALDVARGSDNPYRVPGTQS